MKIAPLLRSFGAAGHESVLVHTGQHYDASMSDAFFRDLEIPPPDHHLEAGSGSHAVQTARVMERFEPVLLEVRPDWLVVVGDVNSTLACALVAVKLKSEVGCRIAHVEAGLRSGDWRMPEEVNRVLTDRISDLLLTPSPDARPNLLLEGIPEERIRFVGNVMIDTLMQQLPAARALDVAGRFGLARREYAVATLHRPSNVDSPDTLRLILAALERVSERWPVVLPLHPRTLRQIETFGLSHLIERIRIVEPLGYREMLSLTDGAALVLTDSGGLQEETTALGVPCVTLREQTERPITIHEGTNRLAPFPITTEGVVHSARRAVEEASLRRHQPRPTGWDGQAAHRITNLLATFGSDEVPAVPPLTLAS